MKNIDDNNNKNNENNSNKKINNNENKNENKNQIKEKPCELKITTTFNKINLITIIITYLLIIINNKLI